MDKNEVKKIFDLYEYHLLKEEEDYMVYAVGRNLYPGVEIVCFNNVDTARIDKLTEEFRSLNYSVRVCKEAEVENIEDYLFDWFFQVKQANAQIKNRYKEYTSAVMHAYGLDQEQLAAAKYEYVRCPYTVERNYTSKAYTSGVPIINSLRSELDSKGARLVIVEAPAGYGKTSTTMELLNSYSDVTSKVRPFYMELYKDRQAPTFYYLLISQINKTFNVLLGDTIVMHNIKEGRIPLIIDGFDELLNEDLDHGNSKSEKNKGKTMLETIAELLEGNAKIILTTRKTAILSGPEFYDWYEQKTSSKQDVDIVRYKLEQPRIEDWLSEAKMRLLPSNIHDLSNPVILGYLHFLSDVEYKAEAHSDSLVQNYVTKLLTREIERQQLPFSDINEQQLIYERLASAFAYNNINSDSRKNVKNAILLLSSDILEKYATPSKDTDNIANSLTNHALLDRKGDNNIGFINDFILGLFLGYSLIDVKHDELPGYYKDMSLQFLEKVIEAMAACDEEKREYTCMQLEDMCSKMTPDLRLFSEIKLLHKPKSNFKETYLESKILMNTCFDAPSSFVRCNFVNINFEEGKVNFDVFDDCMFIGCKFNQVDIVGKTEGVDFFECVKDGSGFDPNFHEVIETIDKGNQQIPMELEILKQYIPKGAKGRKMQIISRLKNEFVDGKSFKKVFCSLVTRGYILTDGDKSHISDSGLDFLNKNV